MSAIQSINYVPTQTKDSGTTRQLLATSDYKEGMSMAQLIRLSKKKFPDARNGEIARFLTQYTGKFVRPQWVNNVLSNPPKKG